VTDDRPEDPRLDFTATWNVGKEGTWEGIKGVMDPVDDQRTARQAMVYIY